jgi:hypothetical protein
MSGGFEQYAIGNRHGLANSGLLSAAGTARREAVSANCPKEFGCGQDCGNCCLPDDLALPRFIG